MRVLIVGATSAIAQETAKLLAAQGHSIFLIGRNLERLGAVAADLRVRGAGATGMANLDVLEFHKHRQVLDEGIAFLGGLDVILIAHGVLPDQKACEESFDYARATIDTNFVSIVSILTPVAQLFERQKSGTIAVISSVAGDRGRQSNYVYGATKGALNVFLEGLRNRLAAVNVTVITVKPGFVDSPMTADVKKNFLFVPPATVAKRIVKAIVRRNDTVYVRWYWFWIMTLIKVIPEPIFKRLKL
jgi:short-subunit dehydrogenase